MKKSLVFIPALVFSLATPLLAAERQRFVIIADGNRQAGEYVITESAEGVFRTTFVYKDNGRGPEFKEEFRLAADGSFQEYHVQGQSTFGSVIDEKFTRQGSKAQWKSAADSGEKIVSGPAFYVPNVGSPTASAIYIEALGKRPGPLTLLPSGELRQKKLDELTVQSGAHKQHVQLLALEGIGLAPNLVWATAGKNPKLFALITPGIFGGVPEGWTSAIHQLEERQKAAAAKYLTDISSSLSEPLTELTVVRNARVFDSEKAELTGPSDVYFKNGRVTAVLPAGSKAQEAVTQIDAAGKVLLPGLFDMHAHLAPWDGRLHLAAGVTTVRDLGNNNEALQQIMTDIDKQKLLAPQVVPAGFLEGESPYSARLGFQIKTLPEAQAAVDWYAQNGYPQLKIYNSFPKEILRETVAYAHSRGMRVSGHVPAFMKASEVVEQGFDEVQHINQLILNFFVKPETDTRTLDRFYLVAEQAAEFDLDSKPVQDFIALLKEHKTVIDPTLAAFDFIRHRDGTVPEPFAAILDHLPPDVQRNLRMAEMKIPDDATADRYKKSFSKLLEFTARMYKAGIPVVAGTDGMAGFTLQSELELYVKAGLTPSQALQIATKNGALYSRVNDRGVIAAGKKADLILIDGDPTKDIGDLRKVALVITQGRLLRPDLIYRSMGIKPFDVSVPAVVKAVADRKVSRK